MPPSSGDPAITPERLVESLQKTSIFSAIADKQLQALARACQVIRLAPGERLFEQNETGDAAYLILEGTIDIEVATETGPSIVAKVSAGELVGEIAAFSDRKRNAAVLSLTGAQLLRIGREAIFDLMQRDPSCAMNVIAELGGRLDRSNNSVAVMSQAAQALANSYFEALDMIARAVESQPDSGAIVDSLAWVLYRLGRYDEAIIHMVRAAELEPLDPIISDHLGDVLWAVGREAEARFQWQRALSFAPEEKDAIRIRAKLAKGLDKVLEYEGAPPLTVPRDER